MPANNPKMISVQEANDRTEKAVAQRCKNKDRKLAELDGEIATTEQQLADAQTKIAELQKQAEQSPQQQIDKLQAEHDERVQALQAEIDQARNEREALEAKTNEMAKQSALARALSKYAKIDDGGAETAVKLFADRIETDDQGQAKFRADNGELVEVDSGVRQALPDFLRPAGNRGGSGAADAPLPTRRKSTEVDQAEQALKKLRQQCVSAGSPAHLVKQVLRQQQKIEYLKQRRGRR